jgi:predicted DCC family thiol-disulfide oxidoreductase YuxK
MRQPILIYDGKCGFCKIWVEYWRRLTGERIDYAASQDVASQYPEISAEDFKRSVWLVYPDGRRVSGAEAAFELMAHAPRKGWALWIYRHVPGFRSATEASYRFIAQHRDFSYWVTRIFWGEEIEPASHRWTRSLFLRGLGLVYLIAFVSLAPQIIGLVGKQGILPVPDYSDTSLLAMCWTGAALAVALITGVLPVPAAIGLYVLYFLLDVAGQDFLSFQWDALLLETGFAAILLAPFGVRPSYSEQPSMVALWVQRFLIFRLMLESGAVKLLSGDPAWRNLAALDFHYETQPLPTPLAWYAHHLPNTFQKFSTAAVFVVELAVPLLFLMPRRLRVIGAWTTIAFQLLIAATGNYAFFNLLIIVLCVTLLDDQHLRMFIPSRLQQRTGVRISTMRPWRRLVGVTGMIVIVMGLLQLFAMVGLVREIPIPLQRFQIVNRYGLFAVMTTSRPEIIVEGSDDGQEWKAYEFKFKPGDPNRRPGWVAPYQPRLDWQMWFAALGTSGDSPWFERLVIRLLEGSPDVLRLFQVNPFPDQPPLFVRALVYDYHFSGFVARRETGAWWTRRYVANYFPAVSLPR